MHCTWTIKCIASAIVVLSLIKSQPDVCRPLTQFMENQSGNVAPELESSSHRQPHGTLRQMTRPVHYLVRQVLLVPFPSYKRKNERLQDLIFSHFRLRTAICNSNNIFEHLNGFIMQKQVIHKHFLYTFYRVLESVLQMNLCIV